MLGYLKFNFKNFSTILSQTIPPNLEAVFVEVIWRSVACRDEYESVVEQVREELLQYHGVRDVRHLKLIDRIQ